MHNGNAPTGSVTCPTWKVRARLNIVCDQRAALALRRLAAHKGMTQAAMLERLILDADARATVKMSAATWDAYHAIK